MLTSSPVIWIAIALVVVLVAVLILSRRRHPPLDRESIIRETREAAKEAARRALEDAAPGVAQDAGAAAIRAYQLQQDAIKQEEAEKRRDAAARARETRIKKIESLQAWRPTFVLFVKRLAEPFFDEWRLDKSLLDEWAEERTDVYIKRKPYVLEIIQSIHADAQKAAEALSGRAQKSTREIARERAKALTGSLERNSHCPYCGCELDERTHLDHIVPVQRGGPSTPWNMVYVCIPCNRAKRDLSLVEFVDSDYARERNLRMTAIAERLRTLDKYVELLR